MQWKKVKAKGRGKGRNKTINSDVDYDNDSDINNVIFETEHYTTLSTANILMSMAVLMLQGKKQ